jgi:hypothetical protein
MSVRESTRARPSPPTTGEERTSRPPRAARPSRPARASRASLASRVDAVAAPLDPLRERVAAPELARARALAGREGLAAALAFAGAEVAAAEAAREAFDELARGLDRDETEAAREARVAAYLRATVGDRRALQADLRALRRRDGALDPPALAARAARIIADHERSAEVALAVVRQAVEIGDAPRPNLARHELQVPAVLGLAQAPGAWTRRVEALGLLAAVARGGLDEGARAALSTPLLALSARSEHRWVQPAALAALAAVEPRAALAVAKQRLADPGGGDDFLVRERLLDLAARGALGTAAWEPLASLACADPSEHVRLRLARGNAIRPASRA